MYLIDLLTEEEYNLDGGVCRITAPQRPRGKDHKAKANLDYIESLKLTSALYQN